MVQSDQSGTIRGNRNQYEKRLKEQRANIQVKLSLKFA